MLSKMSPYSMQISAPSSNIMTWMLMLIFRASSTRQVLKHYCAICVLLECLNRPNRPYKLPMVHARQDTVNKRKRKWKDHRAKLDRAIMACQAAFGHLDEGVLFKHHRYLQGKLELFQDRTMEAEWKYNKAVRNCVMRSNDSGTDRSRRI